MVKKPRRSKQIVYFSLTGKGIGTYLLRTTVDIPDEKGLTRVLTYNHKGEKWQDYHATPTMLKKLQLRYTFVHGMEII